VLTIAGLSIYPGYLGFENRWKIGKATIYTGFMDIQSLSPGIYW